MGTRLIAEFVRVNRRFRLEPVLVSNRAVPSLLTCKRAFSYFIKYFVSSIKMLRECLV